MSDYQFNPNVEQWKEIPGFPGYEVSTFGAVISYQTGKPKIMKHKIHKRFGYPCINLRVAKYKQKSIYVHTLVLVTFIGPCPHGMQACHNDGIRENCCLTNLRWDTAKNNQHDRITHGTAWLGENHPRSVLTSSQVLEIRKHDHLPAILLSQSYNINVQTVYDIRHRRTWRHI